MQSLVFLFFTLITFSRALYLPATQLGPAGNLQLTPSNGTLHTNTTLLASQWPPVPFRDHIKRNAYLNVLAYSSDDPPDVSSEDARRCLEVIIEDIRALEPQNRRLPSAIVFSKECNNVYTAVTLWMGDGGRTLKRSQSINVIGTLWNLTKDYGVQGIEQADVEVDGYVISSVSLRYLT